MPTVEMLINMLTVNIRNKNRFIATDRSRVNAITAIEIKSRLLLICIGNGDTRKIPIYRSNIKKVFFCKSFIDFFFKIPNSSGNSFSAGRSRKLILVPIIQSLAQLEKNYGKEGAEIIQDNVQDTIFGGFAPNSQTAEVLSKALGSRTVMSGYISRGKNDPSQTLQMVERPLMTPDELKSIPKGQFIVMKTGTHPMRTRLRLFLDWGITFGEPYVLPERAARKVAYASKQELEAAILGCHSLQQRPQEAPATPATTPKNRTQGREQEEWEKLGPSTSIKGLKKPGGEAT